jgi:hypothetical protein
MRRFLVTSPKFNGIVEIFYNEKGTLCKVDLTQAEMELQTIIHFLGKVSPSISTMTKWFSNETAIVEAAYEVSFEMFYKDYPLHRNRYKVEKIWDKMNKAEQVKAFHSLHAYKKYLTNNSHYLKPMIADRYLRDREYETEWNKI